MYKGSFKNWEDVVFEFNVDMPEPEEVILARYHTEQYEGYAWVVYRNGPLFYEVAASHCSCFGLEDQWNPEEYNRGGTLLREALIKRSPGLQWTREELDFVIDELCKPRAGNGNGGKNPLYHLQ